MEIFQDSRSFCEYFSFTPQGHMIGCETRDCVRLGQRINFRRIVIYVLLVRKQNQKYVDECMNWWTVKACLQMQLVFFARSYNLSYLLSYVSVLAIMSEICEQKNKSLTLLSKMSKTRLSRWLFFVRMFNFFFLSPLFLFPKEIVLSCFPLFFVRWIIIKTWDVIEFRRL